MDAITALTWQFTPAPDDAPATDRFLRLACLNYTDDDPARHREAAQMLHRHPELPAGDLAVAAACADVDQVRHHLALVPDAATQPGGPYGWTPLMYAAYARVPTEPGACLTTARLLLEAGADPDDGRFHPGLPTPFTLLTGVFGGGERDQPPHPHALALARLLLRAGADPNDGQTLYNRMFSTDDDFLELLFEFGLGQGDGGPWRRLLPDRLDSPATLLRDLLDWAVTHDQRARVARLARHGVDVISAFGNGATPAEVALRNGHRQLAEQLHRLGAPPASLDPVDTYICAALAGDAVAASGTPAEVVAAARHRRPGLVVWAAGCERLDAVELLVAAGFDVNALGRGDVPVEQPWQSALHTAVERRNAALVVRLLELGADKQLRDQRFDGTALDWAEHLGHSDLAGLLRE